MINITNLIKEVKFNIEKSKDLCSLESVRIKYLGKKGYLTKETMKLRELKPELRPTEGILINKAKKKIQKILIEKKKY